MVESGSPSSPAEIYSLPIEELDLTVRNFNHLLKSGARTVADVLESTTHDGLTRAMELQTGLRWSLDEIPIALLRAGVDQEAVERWRNGPDTLPAPYREQERRRSEARRAPWNNFWTTYPLGSGSAVNWVASLPDDLSRRALLDWQRRILADGEGLGIYRIVDVDVLKYNRARHGPVQRFLDAHPDLTEVADGFEETGMILDGGLDEVEASSRVAYYTSSGRIREAEVASLDALPLAAPCASPSDESAPAIALWSHSSDQGCCIETSQSRDGYHVVVSLLSDIWLPWTAPWVWELRDDDEAAAGTFADNRPLAHRHTPRLNEFLRRAREATFDVGGAWQLQRGDEPEWMEAFSFEVSDEVVLLSTPSATASSPHQAG